MSNSKITFDYSKEQLPQWIKEAIATHLAIEQESAQKAGALGFMSRQLILASLPYKNPKMDVFTRVNGDFSLRIIAGYSGGIPYGVYPRLLTSWLTTEAVKTKEREIFLGDSLAGFLRDVCGVSSTGGKNGTITRVNEQMKRLFGALITAELKPDLKKKKPFKIKHFQVAEEATIDEHQIETMLTEALDDDDTTDSALWLPKIHEKPEWNSTVTLTENFFNECINNPVPIDLRAYKALKKSPLAMDIYTWLTYRMSYVNKRTRPILWESLLFQFGSNFTSRNAISDFKKAFASAFKSVKIVYPDVNVEFTDKGLILLPSPTHVHQIEKNYRQPSLF